MQYARAGRRLYRSSPTRVSGENVRLNEEAEGRKQSRQKKEFVNRRKSGDFTFLWYCSNCGAVWSGFEGPRVVPWK
jgi:rubrerythrin